MPERDLEAPVFNRREIIQSKAALTRGRDSASDQLTPIYILRYISETIKDFLKIISPLERAKSINHFRI